MVGLESVAGTHEKETDDEDTINGIYPDPADSQPDTQVPRSSGDGDDDMNGMGSDAETAEA